MMEQEIVNYIEECLQDYPANLTRIEVLRRDLEVLRASTDVKGHMLSALGESRKKRAPSDPVHEYVAKIERLEFEIERLDRITMPITRMIKDLKSPYALKGSLNDDFIKVLGLYYFGRNTMDIVLKSGGWSRATFFRRKKELIKLTQDYLGILCPPPPQVDFKS